MLLASILSWCQPRAYFALIPPSTTSRNRDLSGGTPGINVDEMAQGMTRTTLLQAIFFAGAIAPPVQAFDGGVGGLGKTKPSTGVVLFEGTSTPIQNERGFVSAEIRSISGKPILVQFQTPWPLLPTTSGLEARDLRTSESAFVQLVPSIPDWQNRKNFQHLLYDSVLSSRGKFGAYGVPTDVRVKPYDKERGIYVVSFTSYTPAMRESERQLWIKPIQVEKSLVMLVIGTTRNAFSSHERMFSKIVDSFIAVSAPETNFRGK